MRTFAARGGREPARAVGVGPRETTTGFAPGGTPAGTLAGAGPGVGSAVAVGRTGAAQADTIRTRKTKAPRIDQIVSTTRSNEPSVLELRRTGTAHAQGDPHH